MTNMEAQRTNAAKHQRIKLSEINSYLTCQLCKGYLIDATTISECLHSFCRSCIIKFLRDKSHCPVCEVLINKAKPNLKLDKTLQDVVYKLVPELFLSEMCRRQTFYQNHPDIGGKVSPEQRGEDTERTIFNPRDTFSLSIEYISDDSTPGAILLPSSKANIAANKESASNNKTNNGCTVAAASKEMDCAMKRFLQCPGMCRVDVLKKFVRNKYNVDTNRFHIDILYKRVPLPDHYTLIDIAYIYSWKRNEPMKFYFRITDIQLVKDRFDYLEPSNADVPATCAEKRSPPVVVPRAASPPAALAKAVAAKPAESLSTSQAVVVTPPNEPKSVVSVVGSDAVTNKENNACAASDQPSNEAKSTETSDRLSSSELNCGVASQKVESDKDANNSLQPIVNVQVDAKSNVPPAEAKRKTHKHMDKRKGNKRPSDSKITKPSKVAKLELLTKSVKLTKIPKQSELKLKLEDAYNFVDELEVNQKLPTLGERTALDHKMKELEEKAKVEVENPSEQELFLKSFNLAAKSSIVHKPDKAVKRKLIGLVKEKAAKKQKVEKKPRKPKAVKVDKIRSSEPAENLKTLLNTCKIPSSLSITCVKGDRETQMKPVINHIEILKLPEKKELDENKQKLELEKVGTTMQAKTDDKPKEIKKDPNELSITITIETPNDEKVEPSKPVGIHPNLPKVLQMGGSSKSPARHANNHSYQKMYEEAIKKPEFAQKIQSTYPAVKNNNKVDGKRNLMEIASQLYEKTKQEQKKAKVETINNLHSASLGLNYTISVNQNGVRSDGDKCKASLINLPAGASSPGSNSQQAPQLNSKVPSQVCSTPKINFLQNQIVAPAPNSFSPKQNGSTEPTPLPLINHQHRDLLNQLTIKPASPKLPALQRSSPNPQRTRPEETSSTPLHSQNNYSHCPTIQNKMSPHPSHLPIMPNQISLLPSQSHPVRNLPSPSGSKNVYLKTNHTNQPSPTMNQSAHKSNPASTRTSLPITKSPRPPQQSPNSSLRSPNPPLLSPKPSNHPPAHSPKASSNKSPSTSLVKIASKSAQPMKSPKDSSKGSPATANIDPNQILEKYKIQNLAQLTASLNFNTSAMGLTPANQLAAIQQAMIYKHLEMQSAQNWLSMNPNPLVQYEKYLQSLNGSAGVLGKDN